MSSHSIVRYGINPALFSGFSDEDWQQWDNAYNPCPLFALFQTRISRVGDYVVTDSLFPAISPFNGRTHAHISWSALRLHFQVC
jgi:hypothetical protein